MRSRRLRTVLLLVAIPLAGLLALWMFAPRDPITAERCEAIKTGMSTQEVEAILVVPPGDYGAGEIWRNVHAGPERLWEPGPDILKKTWTGDEHGIDVWFRDGTVEWADRYSVNRARMSLWSRVLGWIGL